MRRTTLPLSVAILALAGHGLLQAQALDTTTFIVMGEGMAAGMANYGLSSVMQNKDFPVLIANAMGSGFEQPLIQPPGIGDIVGYPGQEVRLQTYPQGAVRQQYYPTDKTKDPIAAPPLFVMNLSVPALTLADSISLRPVPPVVHKDMKQTVFNMILGFPQLVLDNVPLWTQLEYAENMFPTVAMVELGYYESITAAVAGDPTLMPDPTTFGNNYATVLKGLRGTQAQVIATTIPNPFDTAYFNTTAAASAVDQTNPAVFAALYHPFPGDYFTRNGIQEIANQLYNGIFGTLPADGTASAATATAITNAVNALNAQIVSVAKSNGAVVYDLNAYLHKIKVAGAAVGGVTVTGDYLGGFYSLDAIYPSATGHALIANDILTFINSTYKKSFPLVDVGAVVANDPTTQNRKPSTSAVFTTQSLGLSQ